MPSWKRITVPDLPEFPAFAHAAVAGDHIYIAGMLGLTDDFSGVVEGAPGRRPPRPCAMSNASSRPAAARSPTS